MHVLQYLDCRPLAAKVCDGRRTRLLIPAAVSQPCELRLAFKAC